MKRSVVHGMLLASAILWAAPLVWAQTGGQTPPQKPAATQSTHSTATQPAPTSVFDHALLNPKALTAAAPAEFNVKFVTTQGDFTVHVTRDWAPRGADRFYNLVRHHYYDGVRFFRVVQTPRPFMAQFGISPYAEVAKVWDNANISDDPVKHHNTRGAITFATAGPNTRTTQLFINYGDNSGLDPQGFAPFGEVIEGMNVVDKLYGGYGDAGAPDQSRMRDEGKAYTDKSFPKLDYIKSATLVTAAANPQ